ncbi:MAG: hypothetical protein ACLT4Y_12520 [Bifidobacterium breve]
MPCARLELIFDILDEFDMVLIMTVEPGFGGRSSSTTRWPSSPSTRRNARRGLKTRIQVDGGVSPKTAHIVAEAGAACSWLVPLYGAENRPGHR